MNNINIRSHYNSIWPVKVIIVCSGMPDEHKTLTSQEEMNQLLEEVKLFNSENENQKRIISI